MNPNPMTCRHSGPLAELHEQLLAEGYFPGTPTNLRLDTRSTDQELCRRMRCPCCRQRGLAYRPYTDGKKSYRVVASCPTCNAAEEV